MTQLWLVPVDEPSYQETLDQTIDLSDCAEKPETFPDQARVWGVRTDPEQGSWERNRRNLKRMETGDPLLIYRNSLSKYTATGRVGEFWLDTDYVRDEYWSGGPARDVYTVENYREIDLSREAVNNALGYKESFWPQGFWKVGDDRPVDRLLRRLEDSE